MYNGYKNWETWNTCLWLANDEPLYRAVCDMRDTMPAQELVEDLMPDGTPDMGSSVHYAEVDWEEVADAIEDM